MHCSSKIPIEVVLRVSVSTANPFSFESPALSLVDKSSVGFYRTRLLFLVRAHLYLTDEHSDGLKTMKVSRKKWPRRSAPSLL